MKLYSVDDVVRMFPKDAVDEKEVRKAIMLSGAFSEIGKKSIFLTEYDLEHFWSTLSAPRSPRAEPDEDTNGLMVVISEAFIEDGAPYYIGWCRASWERTLLDKLQLGYPGNLSFVCTLARTPAQVKAFKLKHTSRRDYGNWYRADMVLRKELRALEKAESEAYDGGH